MQRTDDGLVPASFVTCDYSDVSWREPVAGLQYAPVIVGSLGASLMRLAAGAESPQHTHPDPQISYVVRGRIRFVIDDPTSGPQEVVVGPGEMVGIASEVPHRIEVLEESEVVEAWAPADRHNEAAVARI